LKIGKKIGRYKPDFEIVSEGMKISGDSVMLYDLKSLFDLGNFTKKFASHKL